MEGDFRLGNWLVQPQLNQIVGSGRDTTIEPKVMEVMVYLAEHRSEVSSKERIISAVWPDTFVTDDVLKHAIFELRKALADDAQAPRFIQTIPRKGYRLIAPVAKSKSEEESRYRIVKKLGQGGMGEVFLAEDRLLRRKVALKFVREDKRLDESHRKRLLREARSAAALDHAFIAKIYDMGERDGKAFIVMEYVEGETLKETLARGCLPLQETLPLAAQMAAALEEAHNKGIIHRDFKPANVTLTSEGQVKVLDFGLAKAIRSESSAADLSDSTSITIEGGQVGVIAGTTPYLSPEQARGQAVDKQTDIWAFGCVLFECLGGKRPFEGETPMDVLGAIVGKDPDWESLPGDTPVVVRSLLSRCLQKDPDKRLHDIADARIEIEEALARPSELAEPGMISKAEPALVAPPRSAWLRSRGLWTFAVLVLGIAIGSVAIWNLKPMPPEGSRVTTRLQIVTPKTAPLEIWSDLNNHVAISPDGMSVVYVNGRQRESQFYLHQLDKLEAPIPIGGPGYGPFFSPDGTEIGFAHFKGLKRLSIREGVMANISHITGSMLAGGSWGADGTVVYGLRVGEPLRRVAAAGEPEVLTTLKPGEAHHAWPEILPGDEAVLFTVIDEPMENLQIAVLDLATREHRVLFPGSHPRYSPTGHIVYGRDEDLWGVPFDLDSLVVTGKSVPVVENLFSGVNGATNFDFSATGSLIYVPADTVIIRRPLNTLVWVDREGNEKPLGVEPREYGFPRISPEGKRVALAYPPLNGWQPDVWILDLETKKPTRLTRHPMVDWSAIWTPEGSRVVFASNRAESFNLYQTAADSSGEVELLARSAFSLHPMSWSGDGKMLVYREWDYETHNIGILSMEGERIQIPIINHKGFYEAQPEVSPNGRWIAYGSDESGDWETWVRPFPDVDRGKYPIGGQGTPRWSPDGRELFFASGGKMMAVSIQYEPEFTVGIPELLFEKPYDIDYEYDVHPDGQRFIMVKPLPETEEPSVRPEIILVQNWFEELERLVPAGN